MNDITVKEFDVSILQEFSTWLRDEWLFVEKFPNLYESFDDRRIPSMPRSGNTIAAKMKLLRCFLEVPQLMSEVRDIFVLHCYIGCRVNDLRLMTWDNVAVADGVPYIHYMPQKTALQQEDELATPLMHTALEILKKYDFKFPLLRNIWGKDGYNHKIKELLEHCDINRKSPVRDTETGKTKYVPIYELASTKLARKTFVNSMRWMTIWPLSSEKQSTRCKRSLRG